MSFDYAKPFDIMAGYWVGTASIYSPHGVYLMSTKSYVSVYWTDARTLSFRESAEDDFGFKGGLKDYTSARGTDVENALNRATKRVTTSDAARVMTYDFEVVGPYCTTGPIVPVSVTGRQTRPDAYQFHVKIQKDGYYHHVYNSHHLPTPDDWHIIGPVVGPVKGTEGEVGLSVVQFFRRISYDVPTQTIHPID
jgi:hypothetical protein